MQQDGLANLDHRSGPHPHQVYPGAHPFPVVVSARPGNTVPSAAELVPYERPDPTPRYVEDLHLHGAMRDPGENEPDLDPARAGANDPQLSTLGEAEGS